jgi:hypothetical protein
MDFIFIGALVALAALTWGLVVLCERLGQRS